MASRVTGPAEARVASAALRVVDADVRKAITASMRQTVTPVWTNTVQSKARRPMDARVLSKGARANVGASPSLVAANSSKALSGGLVPSADWRAFEFGAKRGERTTYTARSRKGKSYKVTRHAKRQLPEFKKAGRVLYPSVAEVGPRFFALWTQTATKLIFDALKKGEA